MNKHRKRIPKFLCIVVLIFSITVMLVAAKEGIMYSDEFKTYSSVMTTTHSYGYRDIHMKATKLKPTDRNERFTLQLYVRNGSSGYVGLNSCVCDSNVSGGTYVWKDANTNKFFAKPGRFVIKKQSSNNEVVSGTIQSWSSE